MAATVTIRLVELELSAGAYDGSKVDLSVAGGGYVEVNQTYTEITIADTIRLDADDPSGNFKKRMLQFIFGTPHPTAYVVGKERR